MVIDRQELGAQTDTDGDGTFAEQFEGNADVIWQARLDTRNFVDGPITVHYIAMDRAGNATHYTAPIDIGNNKPIIRDIRLGTHTAPGVINWGYSRVIASASLGINSITGVQERVIDDAALVIPTNFRIRNNRFEIDINTLFGNNQKHYRVSYVTEGGIISATEMVRGNVYTIEEPGATPWTRYGAPANGRGITFVATGRHEVDGSGGDIGTVKEYNYVDEAGTSVTGTFGTNNAQTESASGDSAIAIFTNFEHIDDTEDKEYNADGTIIPQNARHFLIKVFDSTVPGATGTDIFNTDNENQQLAHVALIAVDVDNNDTRPPVIDIQPFFWEQEGKRNIGTTAAPNLIPGNSLYDSSRANGHIELPEHLASADFDEDFEGVNDLDPKVSGRVTFRGAAYDDNTIGQIFFRITNNDQDELNFTDTGATSENIGSGPVYYRAANFTGGVFVPVDDRTDNGWEFEIESETHDQDGHRIEWALHFDSNRITGGANADNVLTVVARHLSTGTIAQTTSPRPSAEAFTTAAQTGGINGTDDLRTPQYRFDVVPYISEVVTGLTRAYSRPSAFNRSALGWYPVREGDTITIRGFNLRAADNPTVNINGSATGITFPTNNAFEPPAVAALGVSNSLVRVGIGNTVTSGPLVVTVNGQASLNNLTSKEPEYNQEPNNTNNNILDDSRNLYIWSTGYLINDSNIQSPFMRMNNSGGRYISLGKYFTAGQLKVIENNGNLTNAGALSNGNGTANDTVMNQTNRYLNTTIGVTNNGEWAVAASNMTAGQSVFLFGYNRYNMGTSNDGGNTTNNAVTNRRRIQHQGADPYRTRFPRVAVQPTATANTSRMILGYYDARATNNPITLHYGTNNGAANATWTGNFPNLGNPGNPESNPIAAQRVADNNSTKARGSQYLAVGLQSGTGRIGRPVIAWYDSTNQCLWFSYAPAVTTATGIPTYNEASWQANAVKIVEWAGSHVDMAIDGNDNIHLAYVDVINGGLYYTWIPAALDYDIGTQAEGYMDTSGNIKTVRVDTFLQAGTKLMINVRRETYPNPSGGAALSRDVPYISYIQSALSETRNSVRVAWPVEFDAAGLAGVAIDGTDENDFFTGAWEVMTVPAGEVPLTDEFVCNGVPAGVPTGTGATWAGAPLNNSTLNAHTNMNRSILISYMTTAHYEGAILKKDIW